MSSDCCHVVESSTMLTRMKCNSGIQMLNPTSVCGEIFLAERKNRWRNVISAPPPPCILHLPWTTHHSQNVDPPSRRLRRPSRRLFLPYSRYRYVPLQTSPQNPIHPPYPGAKATLTFLFDSKRTLLPLRTSRRTHCPSQKAPHPPHLHRNRPANPPRPRGQLPALAVPVQRGQPRRIPGQSATLSHCEAERSRLHLIVRYASSKTPPTSIPPQAALRKR